MLEEIAASVNGLEILPGHGTLRELRHALRTRETTPDGILLDVVLPDGKGWEALKDEPISSGQTKVFFATGKVDQPTLSFFARRKISGFIHKASAGFEDWKSAFDCISKRRGYCSASLLPDISSMMTNSSHWSKWLTAKELEILPLFAAGRTNQELGHMMNSSAGTIQVHRKNIMRKISVSSTPELMRWARRYGITA